VSFFKTTIHFQGSSKSLSLKLPNWSFRAFFAVRKVITIGLLLLFIQAGIIYTYQHFLGKAVQQRASLDTELQGLQSHLLSLDQNMEFLFEEEDLVYAKFGLTATDRNARELGTGGVIDPLLQLIWATSPTLELADALQEKSSQLANKILMNQGSFSSINNYILKQHSNWQSIPSISPTRGRYASPYGTRTHPITGFVRMHKGVDIANDRWTPIYAPANGAVQRAQFSASLGNFVAIDHGNGIETKYGHMQQCMVKPGQFVKRYQIIGYMGNTGLSAGSHLHYEVWVNGTTVNPVNYILPNDHSIE